MTIDPKHLAMAVETVLLLAGCVLLWHHGLSPAGRAATLARTQTMPRWPLSLGDFFFFLWCVICGGLLAWFAAGALQRAVHFSPAMTTVVGGGAFDLGMLAGIIVFKALFDHSPAVADETLRGPGRVAAAGGATFLIALPPLLVCSALWQQLLQLLHVPAPPQDLIDIFLKTKSPLPLALLILLAVVIAPVTEELIFRGGIFRWARGRLPRWAALLLPAVLFAALHGNLASFAPLIVLGIVLALAYERSGTILVPIIAHGLFNLHTIVLLLSGLNL